MKTLLLLSYLLVANIIFCQSKSLYLEVKVWTYIIDMNDSIKEYSFSSDGNLIETGMVEWERGTFKRTKDKIVLKSAKPYTNTTFKKIILVRGEEYTTRKKIFLFKTNSSDIESETWQIKSIRNKGFIKFLKNQLE